MHLSRLEATSLVVLALLCSEAAGASWSKVNVTIPGAGVVSGLSDGEIEVFSKIPFAAPPVGALRFQKPQPAAPWEGVYNSTPQPPYCVQPIYGGSEDCLYLKVIAPARQKRGAKLSPVYVHIHGGGFVYLGISSDFVPNIQPHELVRRENVVAVLIQYRLGVLGGATLPALAQLTEGSGIYGYLDQVMALQWVKDKIAAFGGNASRVTIGGNSAGAGSAISHLVQERSRGLFGQAILICPDVTYPHKRSAADYMSGIVASSPCGGANSTATLACLRSVPAEALVQITDEDIEWTWPLDTDFPMPRIDKYAALVPQSARVKRVIVTSSKDEGAGQGLPTTVTQKEYKKLQFYDVLRKLAETNATLLSRLLNAYPCSSNKSNCYTEAIALYGDWDIICGANTAAEGLAAAGVPVYAFLWDYISPIDAANRNSTLRRHDGDTGFWLNAFGSIGGGSATAEDRAIANRASSLVGRFVREENMEIGGLRQFESKTNFTRFVFDTTQAKANQTFNQVSRWRKSLCDTVWRDVYFAAVQPTAAQPTTPRPTTAQPTTPRPTTARPTTPRPTTARPTTPRPTTARPTTARPTTARPTTARPTSAQPTTVRAQ